MLCLYTLMCLLENQSKCANLLFDKHKIGLPVDKDTFIELAMIASCNVIMPTPDGYYRQIDGLAI